MPTWTVGDVSGSETLTDDDHLYPGHINELREAISDQVVYNVKDYSVVGDGSTDDTANIQATIDAANTAGGGIVFFPAGTYKITSSLDLYSDIHLQGQGELSVISAATFIADDNILQATGSLGDAVTLTSNAAEGDLTIAVTATSGLSAKDWIKVYSSETFCSQSTKAGEAVRIKTVTDATNLALYDALHDAYTTANSASFKPFIHVENVVIENLKIIGPTDNTLRIMGVQFYGCLNVSVRNCRFERCHNSGIHLQDTQQVRIHNCHFVDNERTGLAYGVTCSYTTQDVVITNCTGYRQRHLVTCGSGTTYGGITRRVTVSNCVANQSMEAGFDTHSAAEDISFIGNIVDCGDPDTSSDGIVFQASRGVISGNIIRNPTRHGILVQGLNVNGIDVIISNNRVYSQGSIGIYVSDGSSATYGLLTQLVISGNLINGGTYGIEVLFDTKTDQEGATITGNTIRGGSNEGIYIRDVNFLTVNGNTILDMAENQYGVYLRDVDSASCAGNTIQCDSNSGTRGFRCDNLDNGTIVGNTVYNAAVGIKVDDNSDYVAIVGNSCGTCTSGVDAGAGANNVNASNA